MNVNQPGPALDYLLQVGRDYAATLAPSAALALLTMVEHAGRALDPLAKPAPEPQQAPPES